MLSRYGEQDELEISRCPGKSCSQFSSRIKKVAGKTWEEKALEAVAGCGKCEGNPPRENAGDFNEDTEIVDETEDIVASIKAGGGVDWSEYPFHQFELVKEWTRIEGYCERLQSMRLQAFLKGWLEKK